MNICMKENVCQDRLGTNVGKVQLKRDFLPQGGGPSSSSSLTSTVSREAPHPQQLCSICLGKPAKLSLSHTHTHARARATTALHCTVLYCTVLYCTVLYCTVLPHSTALHCSALYCTALYCTALHCTALHCTVLPHSTRRTKPAQRHCWSETWHGMT
jgi:hypothetical protein